MTISPSLSLVATGPAFSPLQAELSLERLGFSAKNEPQELGVRGKFKGVPIPFGHGILDITPRDEDCELLADELGQLEDGDVVGALQRAGASEIVLYVNVEFSQQCNFELSTSTIAALSRLDVPVAFSCYPADAAGERPT